MANPQQAEPESVEEKWNTYWTYFRLMDRFLIQGADWTLQLGAYWNYRQFQERQEFDEDTPLGTQKFWSDDFGGDIAFTSNSDLLTNQPPNPRVRADRRIGVGQLVHEYEWIEWTAARSGLDRSNEFHTVCRESALCLGPVIDPYWPTSSCGWTQIRFAANGQPR